MTDNTPDLQELERLRAHNTQLLAELKEAKADAKRLSGELQAAQEARDATGAQLRAMTIGQPVAAMLERISTAPDVLQIMLEKHGFRFELEDGRIVMRDRDGNVPEILEGATKTSEGTRRAVRFADDDLSKLLCEDWRPWDQRSEAAKSFASVIKAPEAAGGGAKDRGPSGDVPAKRDTAASQTAPDYGLR